MVDMAALRAVRLTQDQIKSANELNRKLCELLMVGETDSLAQAMALSLAMTGFAVSVSMSSRQGLDVAGDVIDCIAENAHTSLRDAWDQVEAEKARRAGTIS